MKQKQITVAGLIAILQGLPKDAPVFVRPKYSGPLHTWQDAPVKASGISEMHPENKKPNVTILV